MNRPLTFYVIVAATLLNADSVRAWWHRNVVADDETSARLSALDDELRRRGQ